MWKVAKAQKRQDLNMMQPPVQKALACQECGEHTRLASPTASEHSVRCGKKVEKRWGKVVILGSTACISPSVLQQSVLFTGSGFARRQPSQLLNTAFHF